MLGSYIDLIRGGGIGNESREPIGLVIRRAGAGVLSHVLFSHLPEAKLAIQEAHREATGGLISLVQVSKDW